MKTSPKIKVGNIVRIKSNLELRNSVLAKVTEVGAYDPEDYNYVASIRGTVIYPESEKGQPFKASVLLVQVVPENFWKPLVEGSYLPKEKKIILLSRHLKTSYLF